MDHSDAALRNKLDRYTISPIELHHHFMGRLQQDYGWQHTTCESAWREYCRFLYICSQTDEMCSPSPLVDKVWHLHLTYTQDYWDELCKKTLGKPLHHIPSQDNPAEQQSMRIAYSRTLRRYREEFTSEPPESIWQPATKKQKPEKWRWVNTKEKLVLPGKRWWLLGAALGILALIGRWLTGSWHDFGIIIGIALCVIIALWILMRIAKNTKGSSRGGCYVSGCGGAGCGGCAG